MEPLITFTCTNENEEETITLNLTYVSRINFQIIISSSITTLLDGSTSLWRAGEERWQIRTEGYCQGISAIRDIRRASGWEGTLTIRDVCDPITMTAVIKDFRYNTWNCYSTPYWYRYEIVFEELK